MPRVGIYFSRKRAEGQSAFKHALWVIIYYGVGIRYALFICTGFLGPKMANRQRLDTPLFFLWFILFYKYSGIGYLSVHCSKK